MTKRPTASFFLLFTFIIYFIIPVSVKAQSSPFKLFRLQEDNISIKVNVLHKNNVGYIYVGTSHGLYKFDGTRFYQIHFNNKDYTDTVTAIFSEASGKMWIGFNSGRIGNLINGKIVYFNPEEGTPTQRITAFLQDKQNNIWFSTSGEGVYYIHKERLYLVDSEDGLSDENISSLAITDDGKVLAGSDQGLNIISLNNGKKHVKVIGPKDGMPDYIVTSISVAGNGLFWIGLQEKGLCLYDHSSGRILKTLQEQWKYGQVNALNFNQGSVWIATQNNSLIQFDPETSVTTSVLPGKQFMNITQVLDDAFGNIWLTVPSEGILRLPGKSVHVLPLPRGVDFEHIHSILYDKAGTLWLTNNENELLKNKPETNGYITKKIILNGITRETDITSLYQDNYSNIWIGTLGRGIYILDPRTENYIQWNGNPLFNNASILSINGNDNIIYISSLQGSMAVNLNKENANIYSAYRYTNFDKGVGSNFIYNIFRDSKKRVWFATDGKGITVQEKNSFTNYNSSSGIRDERIYSITEDKQGNIWFSTASAGIYKFDGKRFINYSVNDGLSDLNISAVKTDRQGNVVIIHKKGIDILDPVTENISYINSNRGISRLNTEDLGAVAQDSAGNIFVSSENGIVKYSPAGNVTAQPETVIESVQLFLTELEDNTSGIFSYDENNITFNYTGLYYTDPEQVYYQYRLEGFDSTWVITKDRSKTFPKLAPGKYVFRIQSSLNKNFANADEASYAFEIKQAFYKQWWFLLLCLLVIAGIVYLYVRNREANLKKMERLRQEKIEFRFEVLRNQVNPHFLFNSFNTLISTIEEDPKMAVEYVEQLSDFFRNIVSYRDKDVISVKEEMELLHTYYFLQKKRYGDNLQLAILVTDRQKNENLIPPLTLQLLMENAIKHNVVSKDSPLRLTIETSEDYLIVSNTINPRLSNEKSSGLGLQNIMNRYNLLTRKEVKISDTGTNFIVSLPLLTTDHA